MVWKWREREPSLDELLDDEMMQRVVRRSGSEPAEFRRRLAELATRVAARCTGERSRCAVA
jgi:hypothetical protein